MYRVRNKVLSTTEYSPKTKKEIITVYIWIDIVFRYPILGLPDHFFSCFGGTKRDMVHKWQQCLRFPLGSVLKSYSVVFHGSYAVPEIKLGLATHKIRTLTNVLGSPALISFSIFFLGGRHFNDT